MKIIHSLLLAGAVAFPLAHGAQKPAQNSITTIAAIQGTGVRSVLEGKVVSTGGVVVADFGDKNQLKGFFVQSRENDEDKATSDGLFIYLPAGNKLSKIEVEVGDVVDLTGTVKEHDGQTQLDNLTSLKVAGKSELPTAVEVRLPLASDDSLERFEGMLVSFPQPLTVSGNNDLATFGSLVLSADGRLFNPTNGQGDSAQENARRRIVLDDGSTRRNPTPVPYVAQSGTRRCGDTIVGLVGVLAFDYNSYRIQPTQEPRFVATNPRATQPADVGGTVKIATFNVENYFTTLREEKPAARGAKTAEEFQLRSGKVVAALRRLDADIVGLIEVENNGTKAIGDLVSKLNALYGEETYAAISDPITGTGRDLIKVALIYKPARVARVGESQSDANPLHSRAPLAQTFRRGQGEPFTLVVNHWKSKGGCPDTGDIDRGQGCWNERRTQQAQAVTQWLATLKAENLLVIGDLNAYGMEDPVRELIKSGLASLNLRLPVQTRYSYVFDAQAGYLDHALASPAIAAKVTGITHWAINSDEPELEQTEAAPSPFRSSDHDPLLLGLKL